LEGQRLTIAGADCDGCGICEAACPNGVFSLAAPSEEWLWAECFKQAGGENRLSIICSRAKRVPQMQGVVEISCLGRLAWEFVVAFGVSGVRVAYLSGDCHACDMKKGGGLWQENRHVAQNVLAVLGRDKDMPEAAGRKESRFTNGRGLNGIRLDRRALFSRMFRLVLKSISGGAAETGRPQASRGSTNRRRWLVRLLNDCYDAPGKEILREKFFPWRTLREAGPCFLCGACSALCPVGALKFDDGKALHYIPSFCTQCGLCQTICPYESLVLGEQMPVLDFFTLTGRTLAAASRHICSLCGVEFDASGNPTKCERCTLQEKLGVFLRREGV
jgi:ferredoxin